MIRHGNGDEVRKLYSMLCQATELWQIRNGEWNMMESEQDLMIKLVTAINSILDTHGRHTRTPLKNSLLLDCESAVCEALTALETNRQEEK